MTPPPSRARGRVGIRILSVGVRATDVEGVEPIHRAQEDARQLGDLVADRVRSGPGGGSGLRILLDPSARSIRDGLKWLYVDSPAVTSRILIFSGHAERLRGGDTALVAADSTLDDPGSMISRAELYQYAAMPSAGESLWLFDCCFAFAMTEGAGSVRSLSDLNISVLASSGPDTLTPMEPVHDAGLSPFSQALRSAIDGLAVGHSRLATLNDLYEYVRADASREGRPVPLLFQAGRGSSLRFGPLGRAGLDVIGPSRDWSYLPSLVESAPNRILVASGPRASGRSAALLRAARLGLESVLTVGGRNALEISLGRTLAPRDVPLLVRDLEDGSSWSELVKASETRQVIATTTQGPTSISESVSRPVTVLQLGDLEATDVIRALEVGGLGGAVDDTIVDALGVAAGGSFVELYRLIGWLGTLPGTTRVPDGMMDLPSLGEHLSLIRASTQCHGLLDLLSWFPDVKLRRSVLNDVIVQEDGTADEATDLLVANGLILGRGDWIEMSAPIAAGIPDRNIAALERAIPLMSHMVDIGGIDHFQALRALVALFSSARGTADARPLVALLIERLGSSLVRAAEAQVCAVSLEDVVDWLGDATTDGVESVLVDALRLADRYRDAGEARTRVGRDSPGRTLDAEKNLSSGDVMAMRSITDEVVYDRAAAPSFADIYAKANMMFSQSRWHDARSGYQAALRVLPDGAVSLARKADCMKGLGDIELHDVEDAPMIRRGSELRDLASSAALSIFSPVTKAKILQYLGDTCRKMSVAGDRSITAMTDASDHYYGLALQTYDAHELELGSIMTRQRMAQVAAIRGEAELARDEHLQVTSDFDRLGYSVGLIRSHVCVLLSDYLLGEETPMSPGVARSLTFLRDRERLANMSPYQSLWTRLLVSLNQDESFDWLQHSRMASSIGASRLAPLLQRGRTGIWMAAYY